MHTGSWPHAGSQGESASVHHPAQCQFAILCGHLVWGNADIHGKKKCMLAGEIEEEAVMFPETPSPANTH